MTHTIDQTQYLRRHFPTCANNRWALRTITICKCAYFPPFPSPTFPSPYRNRLESGAYSPNPRASLLTTSTMLLGSVIPDYLRHALRFVFSFHFLRITGPSRLETTARCNTSYNHCYQRNSVDNHEPQLPSSDPDCHHW